MQNRDIFKIFLRFTVIILICSAIAAFFFGYKLNKFSKTPVDTGVDPVKFSVEPGQSLSAISQALEDKGVIENSTMFDILARFSNAARDIKAGEYTVSGPKSPRQILDTLKEGKVNLYRLTVPEGLTVEETAALVEVAGFGAKENFVRLARDKTFAASLGIEAGSLEGYLFPETYFFRKNASRKTIIKKMTDHFKTVFTPDWEKRALSMGFTVHETVTLASIIEKETGAAAERALISSVFHNRLDRGMRLESDPTVIYGIDNFDGNLTRKHLQTKTPYNTYTSAGLPAGPIASPGKMALKAALYPADTDYLFFVSKNDTTHKFSKTMAEHNRAVQKYQISR